MVSRKTLLIAGIASKHHSNARKETPPQRQDAAQRTPRLKPPQRSSHKASLPASHSFKGMAAQTQSSASFGVVGLGVMGSMLALNLAEKTGESIAGFELDPAKAKGAEAKATKEGLGSAFKAYTDLKEFVNALTTPRRIVLLVPAGKPVDSALAALGPLLDKGDCVVDGGNEWYENTERRAAQFSALGLHYVGCGVSGGAEGARHGPSLMAGGPREASLPGTPLFWLASVLRSAR